jgi:hypothetical protein
MRASLKFLLRGSCSAVVMAGLSAGGVHAGDLGLAHAMQSDVVGSLSVMNDLEPSAGLPSLAQSMATKAAPIVTPGFQVRSSIPAVDRSQDYASRELFAHSKSVVPLLVGDIEPTVAPVVRPMSGRSVGARPSLPWSKRSTASASN